MPKEAIYPIAPSLEGESDGEVPPMPPAPSPSQPSSMFLRQKKSFKRNWKVVKHIILATYGNVSTLGTSPQKTMNAWTCIGSPHFSQGSHLLTWAMKKALPWKSRSTKQVVAGFLEMIHPTNKGALPGIRFLGNDFKYVLCSPRSLKKMHPIWLAHIFQMGCFNHQLGLKWTSENYWWLNGQDPDKNSCRGLNPSIAIDLGRRGKFNGCFLVPLISRIYCQLGDYMVPTTY